jgi:hypothetical protein
MEQALRDTPLSRELRQLERIKPYGLPEGKVLSNLTVRTQFMQRDIFPRPNYM